MGLRLDPPMEALLQAVRAEYALGLPGKLGLLEALVAAGEWREARRAAHRLRGSAATYGFGGLGVHASTLEELLIEAGDAPGAAWRERLAGALRDLGVEIERLGGKST